MEEPPAGAAVGFRHLDAHDAEVEELPDQVGLDLRVLVHLAHERPHLGVGEFPYAVPEEEFVFGQDGEGLAGFRGLLGHEAPPDEMG
jgi:hypothetical protein